MREFERTGIYPEFLLFPLASTRRKWSVKIYTNPQQGVLKSRGEVLYDYKFEESSCKYREVQNDGSFTVWMEPEFMILERRD